MRSIVATLFLHFVASVMCYQPGDHQFFPKEWFTWKIRNQKTYPSFYEELERHIMWLSNQEYIDAYNLRGHVFGFNLAMNEYGDLSDHEFQNNYQCVMPQNSYSASPNISGKIYQRPRNLTLPQSVDWRSMGAVSSVKSQGSCCSSYAFGALGTLEGVHALASGKMVQLSAQNIIDCSRVYGNRGCRKGLIASSYYYIIDNNGVDTKKSYPYRGKQMSCHFKQRNIGATMRYFLQVEEGNENDLEAAVATQGPISVVVDASHNIFRFYKSGILNIPNCSSSKVTQALTLIGYGISDGKKYWVVKNSWGKSWGSGGYALLSRGKYNQCGIATYATFPSI